MEQHLHRVTVRVSLHVQTVLHGDQQHNGGSPDKVVGMIGSNGLAVHAPQGIKDVAQSQAKVHVLVQKPFRVVLQHRPGFAGLDAAQLIAPLAQGKVKHQGDAGEKQPVGQGNSRNKGAVENPQQETGYQNGHIHQGDVFPAKAVAQIQYKIQHQQSGGLWLENQEVEKGGQQQQGGGKQPGAPDGDSPGGDGTAAFGGVAAILLHVPDVIDHVDGGGKHTEGTKAPKSSQQTLRLEQLAAADQGKEDQQIFDVVMDAGFF